MDWEARLNDAMSAPAKRMAAAVDSLGASLQRANKAASMDRVSKAVASMKSATASLSGPGEGGAKAGFFESFSAAVSASPWGAVAKGIAAVGAAAAAAAVAVGGLVGKFTHATVEMADFLAGTKRAIDVLTKKAGEGDRAVTVALELAGQLHLDPREAVAGIHEMLGKGFKTEAAAEITKALADLKILSPKANIEKALLAITQIKGKPKLGLEELNGQLADAGLETARVVEQLSSKLGKSSEQVYKMISAGKITGQEGIDAIMAAIKKMGTGKLGEMAEQAARNSFGGLANGIKTSLSLALVEVASAINKGGGMEALKGAMRALLDGLDPNKTPGAKRLTAAASGFVNTLLTALFGPLSKKDAGQLLGKTLDRLGAALESVTAIVRVVGPAVAQLALGFGEGLLEAFSALGEAASSMAAALGLNQSEFKGLSGVARLVGKGLGMAAAAAVVVAGGLAAVASAVVAVIAGGSAMLASFFAPFLALAPLVKGAFYGVEQTILGVPQRIQAAAGGFSDAFFGLVGQALAVLGTFVSQAVAWGAALPGRMASALASSSLVSAAASLGGGLLSAGIELGSNLWQGFVQGIENGIVRVLDAGTRLANAAKSAVAGALTIQSPSKVMAEMGGYTAAGFAQGVDGGAGQVDTAMRDLVAPPPAPVLGRGGAVTSNTLAAGGITVNVILQGETGAQPGAIGSEVRGAVTDALEQMLAQMGLSPAPV